MRSKLNLREGDVQIFLVQPKEVSFTILSASYLLSRVSRAFPVHTNQLRLEKGAKSKAQPLLIVFITPSYVYPVQCKTDHKTGSEAISVHSREVWDASAPVLTAFLEERLLTPWLNEG